MRMMLYDTRSSVSAKSHFQEQNGQFHLSPFSVHVSLISGLIWRSYIIRVGVDPLVLYIPSENVFEASNERCKWRKTKNIDFSLQ